MNILETQIQFMKDLKEQMSDDNKCSMHLTDILRSDIDGTDFGSALMMIMQARKINVSDFAKNSGLVRESLYRSLTKAKCPTFMQLQRTLRGLGFEFAVIKKKG